MSVKLVVVAGARPNFMKVAPLIAAFSRYDLVPILVHTGQHYDYAMSGQFFDDLGLPAPDYHLEAGSGSHAQQTAEVLKRMEPVLIDEQPAGVIVVGDVNSTLAAALAASKLGITVVHVEAGLRSFDRSMPEEINRLATDAITDLFLVTEESGRRNLRREGVPAERIHMIGNLMIDSLRKHLKKALCSDIRHRLIPEERYGLVTLHRAANVDCKFQLAEILGALTKISEEVPLYWPVHPRTRLKLAASGSLSENIHLLDPLGYLDFLSLEAQSAVVLTDSGGIQEETTVLGVPCLTLRENTERPVTIECGTNLLAGTTRASILAAWRESVKRPKAGRIPPLWDGKAGERASAALRKHFLIPSIRIEPARAA
jgi:UDP-N-acetylglucosamine 2-epimerase (non-hydrolysing)